MAEGLKGRIQRLERAARRKMVRLVKEENIHIQGTSQDPLRDATSLNERALQAYAESLRTFVDRSTTFFRGSGGAPISSQAVDEFLRAQSDLNEARARRYAAIKDIRLPGGVMTIDDRMAVFAGRSPATVRPWDQLTASSRSLGSDAAARKMAAVYRERTGPDYERKVRSAARRSFSAMAAAAGRMDLMGDVGRMSDAQFDLAWHYGGIAEHLALAYHMEKEKTLKAVRARKEFVDTELDWAKGVSEWALQQQV